MRPTLFALALAGCAAAQQPAKPELPPEQIIEKSIQAAGGRAAMEKFTSTYAKGIVEIVGQELHSTMELFAKAPNKRLIVTIFEGVGEIRQGFDGKVAWRQGPMGLVEESGDELAATAREATFNGELKWRELYPKTELLGKEKVGDREAWTVRLIPATGKPVTQFYDAETFLLLRQTSNRATEQGPMDIRVDFFDYRDIGGGVKAPFLLKQYLPIGEIDVRLTEIKNNVEIDDAKFVKPAAK